MKFFLTYSILCFALIANAQTTYYVSTSGNDANNGTSIATAWKTIQKAAQTVSAGSTVNILQGTYNERVTMLVTGLPSNYITFQNYQNDVVTIEGAGTSGWAMWLIYGVAYIKLKGINFSYNDSTTGNYSPALVIGNKSQFIQIKNCSFEKMLNTNSTGIAVYGNDTTTAGLHDVTIDSCTFSSYNFQMSQGIGIAGNVYNVTVSNSLFHHMNGQGIALIGSDSTSRSPFDFCRNIHLIGNEIFEVYNQTPGNYRQGILISGARNCVIEKNKIHHCDMGVNITGYSNYAQTIGIVFRENLVYKNYQQGLALGIYNYSNSTARIKFANIHHNTFFENNDLQNGSEMVLFPFDSSSITNNIFYFNNSNQLIYSWFYGVGFQHNEMDYNLYCSPFINPTMINFSWDGNGGNNNSFGFYKLVSNVDLHGYYADPLFVKPYDSVPDFHIYNNSLAKDSGEATFTVQSGETDFYNHSRIFNGRVDIGAVENQNDYAPIIIQTGFENMDEQAIKIYPNPTNQSFFISNISLIQLIEITDLLGSSKLLIRSPKSEIVNVESFPNGIYLVKIISTNNILHTEKIIVQH